MFRFNKTVMMGVWMCLAALACYANQDAQAHTSSTHSYWNARNNTKDTSDGNILGYGNFQDLGVWAKNIGLSNSATTLKLPDGCVNFNLFCNAQDQSMIASIVNAAWTIRRVRSIAEACWITSLNRIMGPIRANITI